MSDDGTAIARATVTLDMEEDTRTVFPILIQLLGAGEVKRLSSAARETHAPLVKRLRTFLWEELSAAGWKVHTAQPSSRVHGIAICPWSLRWYLVSEPMTITYKY